jgi:hypothetical protein
VLRIPSDVVEKVVWGMDHATATPRLTPLLIGRQRVYFGRRTPEHGYDLVAYKLPTRDLLYQVPLIADIADHDHDCLDGRQFVDGARFVDGAQRNRTHSNGIGLNKEAKCRI